MHFYFTVFVFSSPYGYFYFLEETLHHPVNKMDENSFKDGLWQRTTVFTNTLPWGGCRQTVKFNKQQYTTVLSISMMEMSYRKQAYTKTATFSTVQTTNNNNDLCPHV